MNMAWIDLTQVVMELVLDQAVRQVLEVFALWATIVQPRQHTLLPAQLVHLVTTLDLPHAMTVLLVTIACKVRSIDICICCKVI